MTHEQEARELLDKHWPAFKGYQRWVPATATHQAIAEALRQRDDATAQRGKAAGALRPIKALAEFFDSWKEPLPEDAAINRHVTLGHLRQAAAVVQEIENALSPN